MGRFSGYINASPSDPLTQAINVYSTLKGQDRADEELKLRQAADARAAEADKRAAITADLQARGLRQGLEQSQYEFGQKKRQAQNEIDAAYLAATGYPPPVQGADEGPPMAPTEAVDALNRAAGMPDADLFFTQGPVYSKAWSTVRDFATKLGEMPPTTSGTVSFQRNPSDPGREQVFQSLLIASGGPSRLGGIHEYDVADPATGKTKKVKGMVGMPSAILYDRQRDALGLMFQVLDPQTREPILGADGKPLQVPATEGRTNGPDDPVKMLPRQAMIDSAGAALLLQHKAAQSLSQLSEDDRDALTAAWALKNGNKPVLDRLAEKNKQKQLATQIEGLADTFEKGPDGQPSAAEMQYRGMARALRSGEIDPKTAEAFGKAFAAQKAAQEEDARAINLEDKKKRIERKYDFLAKEQQGAINAEAAATAAEREDQRAARATLNRRAELQDEQEFRLELQAISDRNAMLREKVRAAADLRVRNDQDKAVIAQLHKDAKDDLNKTELFLEKAYADPLNRDAQREVKDPSTGQVRRISPQEYMWGDPTWKNAHAALAEARALLKGKLGIISEAPVPQPSAASPVVRWGRDSSGKPVRLP